MRGMSRMNFNEKLMMLRKNKNLSQEQLGNELNVARQTVSKWELGETTPEMDKLIKMSEIFEVSLDELMKDQNMNISNNDINNTNTQKLAGLTIKILKGIGIFLLSIFIITIIMMILSFAIFNGIKTNTNVRVGEENEIIQEIQEMTEENKVLKTKKEKEIEQLQEEKKELQTKINELQQK